jgi:integrase
MPRSRPVSDPPSFHNSTGQHYVTRGGKRIYLGADREAALHKYHRLAAGIPEPQAADGSPGMSAKELASRFLQAQQANWRNPESTFESYQGWLARFLEDHPGLRADAFTVEGFAAWKVSLRSREYSPESINHYLGAVRAMYRFAEDASLLPTVPRLRRVRNEPISKRASERKATYSTSDIQALLSAADLKLKTMIHLGLNCGFGPKDIQDLTWNDIDGNHVTLPRSKTGVSQTLVFWPETVNLLQQLRSEREQLIQRLLKRGRDRSDNGSVFMTYFWRPWSKDAVAEQFRRLCVKVGVKCHGFYRLRHCASTAMSLVAQPHVQRQFMRHSQLQQQVTYTHVPDEAVDVAVMKARGLLLGTARTNEALERSQERAEVSSPGGGA